jgi:SAM-dependent methyltransferase
LPEREDGRRAAAGFDPRWLRLRSTYDDTARSDHLTRLFADSLPENPRLLDLAAGTGANLRYLAPRIGRTGQRWVLADHDQALLDAVSGEMARWPHRAPALAPALAPKLECCQVDLVRDLGSLDPGDFDGIVATALFDLVSADWAGKFTAWLALALRPVLFTLSVDGRLDWTPGDPADTDIRRWIEAHQATDKGFGPALGSRAPELLTELLRGHGYDVSTGESDWIIGPDDDAMHWALIEGYWTAALEIALANSTATIEGWAQRRLDAAERRALTALVGHIDIFARPPESL